MNRLSGTPTNSTKLKAAGLWQRTSAGGNTYFAGRLGGVKVLILENRDRAGEDEFSHHLFFVRRRITAPGGAAQRQLCVLPTSTASANLSAVASLGVARRCRMTGSMIYGPRAGSGAPCGTS